MAPAAVRGSSVAAVNARAIPKSATRARQAGRGGDLAQEAIDAEARGELGMEHLDRNRSLVLQVDRQKNCRHPAAADRAVDGVAIREAAFRRARRAVRRRSLDYG